MNESLKTDFDGVIPTAWMVAYRRSFTDIPFSKEVFDKLIKTENFTGIDPVLKKPETAPQFEGRAKIIDKCVLASGNDQVLELASGYSIRGLEMSRDPDFTYVELDLPKVIPDKQKIITEIVQEKGLGKMDNLHFEGGNVLNFADLERATSHFDLSKPITILNEGLLIYLTMEEKKLLASHIHKILEKSGGVWITTDVSVHNLDKPTPHTKNIMDLTNKNIIENSFKTSAEVRSFFQSQGFSIEEHTFTEVAGQINSYKKLEKEQKFKISRKETEKLFQNFILYVMKPIKK